MRAFRFDFSYSSSGREPFLSDTELDPSTIQGLGYPNSLPGLYHKVWCCTLMYLEFSTQVFFDLVFDIPVRSRREPFLYHT